MIVVLFLGILSYNKAKNTIKDNVSEANRQTIIQTSEKLDITLKQYENLALQLYFDTQMQSNLTEPTLLRAVMINLWLQMPSARNSRARLQQIPIS